MSKEREVSTFKEKSVSFAKKVLGWAIVVGGVWVGLNWFIGATAGL